MSPWKAHTPYAVPLLLPGQRRASPAGDPGLGWTSTPSVQTLLRDRIFAFPKIRVETLPPRAMALGWGPSGGGQGGSNGTKSPESSLPSPPSARRGPDKQSATCSPEVGSRQTSPDFQPPVL